jgi:hypothetical protein
VNDIGHREYAFFAIRKRYFDRVEYPDGTDEEAPAGLGEVRRTRWLEEREREQRDEFDSSILPAAQRAWAAHYEVWRQQLVISERTVRWQRARWPVVHILDPGNGLHFEMTCKITGSDKYYDIAYCALYVDKPECITPRQSTLGIPARSSRKLASGQMFHLREIIGEAPSSVSELHAYFASALEPSLQELYRFFEAEPDKNVEAAFDFWRSSQPSPGEVHIAALQSRWQGRLFHADGQDEVVLKGASGWGSGFPETEVLTALNQLAGDGWRVISVSEDTGAYIAQNAIAESAPIAVRYLLERSLQTDDVD